MPILNLLIAVAVFAQAPVGAFEIELWPGEGRPEFQAVANELVLREAPFSSAKVVRRLSVTRGQQITFDETRYRTMEPGQLQALDAATVTGRVLGTIRRLSRDAYYKGRFPTQTVAVKQGDVIQYLQYRAEGTCFVRVVGQVINADPCPAENDGRFRAITQPKTEWWIRAVWERLPAGWVLVDEKAVKLSGRSS